MDKITRQDKNLLLKSSICQENIELREFLLSFPEFKGVEDIDIENLSTSNEGLYNLLISDDAREAIINNSVSEWSADKHIGEKLIPCELCGCQSSKDKYTIKNRQTKYIFKVGSSCISHFPQEIRLKEGNDILETKKWTNEQVNKASEFYKKYRTGKITFNKWMEKYNNLILVMPREYDKKFKYILKSGKEFYNNFINNTLPMGKTINTFGYIKKDFEYFYRDCINYVEHNKDDKYVLKKSMINEIDKNILSDIKNLSVCKVNNYNARYIISVEFINRFSENIAKMFQNMGLQLKDISSEGIIVRYTYGKYPQLFFKISLSKFTNDYYNIYFTDKFNVSLSKILTDFTLLNTYENVNRFLEIVQSILKKNKYYFKYNQEVHEKKIIEINKRGDNRCAIIDYNEILNEYIQVFALSKESSINYLLDKINSLDWISKKQRKKFDVGNISKINTRTTGNKDEEQYNQYESEKEYYQRIKKDKKSTIKI